MITRLCRLMTSLLACGGALANFLLVTPHTAWADRPWQDASHKAHLIADLLLSGTVMPLLTALPDGTIYSLDPRGAPQRIDPVTGTLYPLTGLPALTTLNATSQGLWGITKPPLTTLLNIAPDGHILNHIALDKAALPESRFSTLQVNNMTAYLADEGVPALVVVDIHNGTTQRLLEGSPSLSAHRPLRRAGKVVSTTRGQARTGGNIRFLMLDHTGQWLFYQSPPGPLYRLGTALLTDPDMSPAQQIEGMATWRDTPSLGGLALSQENNFYMVDIDQGDILKFDSNRLPWRLLHDPLLFHAQDIALLPQNAQAPLRMAVIVQEGDKAHLLTYALP